MTDPEADRGPDAVTTRSDLVERLVRGDRRALARAISRVESGGPDAAELVKEAFPEALQVPLVGITGPSGSGKSTLVDALTTLYREAGETVGILAVDPSSPFSGGALLGDRVRMQRHAEDPGVFLRSMATRGALGGLAAAAYDALTLLAAAGFDRLLVETVGVGQDEVDVAGVADTTCVVLTPATGDEIQAIKAGIMEVADVFVLNKADLPGADQAEAQLRAWVAHGDEDGWAPPIVRTVARDGEGIDDLREALADHHAWFRDSGTADVKRRALARLRLQALVRDRLMQRAREAGFDAAREEELVRRIAAGEIDPHTAAESVAAEIGKGRGDD